MKTTTVERPKTHFHVQIHIHKEAAAKKAPAITVEQACEEMLNTTTANPMAYDRAILLTGIMLGGENPEGAKSMVDDGVAQGFVTPKA